MTEFLALNDVSFEVKQGERVGIIGRNGAGKSTLLKVLSRIYEPTKGRIEINGRLASLLEVGTGFHPELSGRENIFLNGALLGMNKSEIKSKFDEIIAFAEVEKFLDTPVKRYSSGMYVRLAFAVAAHLEPEILIVDEVLAVGDAEFQRKCLGKMKDVSNSGRTVLFVSHNMEAVQKLCNKGLMLSKGELKSSGSIETVMNAYLDSQTEGELVFDLSTVSAEDNAPIKALQLRVTDMNDTLVSELVMGQRHKYIIDFEIVRELQGAVAGLGISSMFGQPIRTTWSKKRDLTPGRYRAIFLSDVIQLTSGVYKLTVGMSSNGRTYHYIDQAGQLTISDVSGLLEDEQIINTKSGLLTNQMEVIIEKR